MRYPNETLERLFPDIVPGDDYTLDFDPTSGRHSIREWNRSEPRPDAATLDREELKSMKGAKIDEFGERAMEDLSPHWTPHRGVEETLHAVLEYLIPILEAQRITVDQRLYANRDIGRKALSKKQQVEAATTPEEVEAIVWEEPLATLESYPEPPLGPRRPGKKK